MEKTNTLAYIVIKSLEVIQPWMCQLEGVVMFVILGVQCLKRHMRIHLRKKRHKSKECLEKPLEGDCEDIKVCQRYV